MYMSYVYVIFIYYILHVYVDISSVWIYVCLNVWNLYHYISFPIILKTKDFFLITYVMNGTAQFSQVFTMPNI